ncbi:type II and III secretion system protein family protein [Sphingobium sp. EM0848]|uniref:type II and III secretion system protein family protein n=1 Tax=Sphingobium sp. EM0848 TaxID=2743473 RepID=UPI003510ADA5
MATDRQSRALRSGGFLIALGLALSVATPMAAQAQSEASLHAGTLEVPLNKSQVVTADRPIAKAMVGNEDVADIMPITNRSIYVLGKKMGTTSLTLYDSAGRVISVIDVSVGPDVLALTDQLRQLVPGEKIDASISNDSIVLNGLVSSPAAADRAAQLAKAYAGDKVINLLSVGSSTQVMVEVRFAEVNRTAGKDIGISGFGLSNNGKFDAVSGKGASLTPDATTGIGVLKLAEITNSFGIFRNVFNIGGTKIEGVLNALESRGLAKTLAQPTLIALSGEKASFLAGGEFPVPSIQSGGGTTNGNTPITVQFKPFGVSLSFTPTVLGDRTINMIVEPEVSQIDSSASLTIGSITIPGLRTRRASTTLELRDGESFAIAGLLQKDFKTTVDQIPLLGSVPILGALFRSTNYQKDQTELLIVVTPHLVAPLKPEQVRLPTDGVRDPSEAETFLLGQAYHAEPVKPAEGVAPAAQAPAAKKEGSYAY